MSNFNKKKAQMNWAPILLPIIAGVVVLFIFGFLFSWYIGIFAGIGVMVLFYLYQTRAGRAAINAVGDAHDHVQRSTFSWKGLLVWFIFTIILLLLNFWGYLRWYITVPIAVFLFVLTIVGPRTRGVIIKIAFVLGVIFILALAFLPNAIKDLNVPSLDPKDAIKEGIDRSTGLTKTNSMRFNPITWFKNFYKGQVDLATGERFEGQVEESSHDKELGLFFGDIESRDDVIKEGEDAVLWTKIFGKAIDGAINVTIDCSAKTMVDNEKLDEKKKLSSTQNFEIAQFEEKDFDCKYEEIPSGNIKFTFMADYGFETLGYVKSYVMDQTRSRELRAQGKDPLDTYNIFDTDPDAVYTQGPVEIGMETVTKQPMIISNDAQRISKLAITIRNTGGFNGYISNVTSVKVQVPRSIRLDDCDREVELYSFDECKAACRVGDEYCLEDCVDYDIYYFKENTLKDFKDIKQYKTFSCLLYTKDKVELIGTDPISTIYFRVNIDYNYRLEKDKIVYVKKDKSSRINNAVSNGGIIWPIQGAISLNSCYGYRTLKSGYSWTRGIDIYAPVGTPVYAVTNGTVIKACKVTNKKDGCDVKYNGPHIKIKHTDDFYTAYLHLSELKVGVGKEVKQGELIGLSGDKGERVTGPHLDFRISTNGDFSDPTSEKDYSLNPLCYLPAVNYKFNPGADSCRDRNDGDSTSKCPKN